MAPYPPCQGHNPGAPPLVLTRPSVGLKREPEPAAGTEDEPALSPGSTQHVSPQSVYWALLIPLGPRIQEHV